MKKILQSLIILIAILFSSCSPVKKVPDDEFLLDRYKIKVKEGKVKKDEIKNYVKSHSKDFKVDESRDIQYVMFDIKPTDEDEADIKKEMFQLINDGEEYSNAAKSNVKILGFKNAKNITEFNSENDSDNNFDDKFYTKSSLSKILADSLFNKEINTVYGPYKEKGFLKLLSNIKLDAFLN